MTADQADITPVWMPVPGRAHGSRASARAPRSRSNRRYLALAVVAVMAFC
jgi:hypothetical protein